MPEHRCAPARTIEKYRAVCEAGLLNAKRVNGGRFARIPQEFEPLLTAGSEAVG
jgi:hypothetical protein